jgi:epoxyqueuosine reductase
MSDLSREVLDLCRDLGFALAGIADAAPTRWSKELTDWLAAGKHGTMAYLVEHVQARLDPTLVLAGARSAIMVADQYATRNDPPDAVEPGRGRIARYARGRDYHEVMKKRLHRVADTLRERFPGATFRSFVDTAPVLEREYAARAGLGWTGKHTLLIEPRLGSYLLLGGVFTTLDLTPATEIVTDHCGTCTRCIDACPTNAITPYSVDATRCLSYLTIEHRGPIEEQFHRATGDWVYGCDICQEVCPHNSPRPEREASDIREEYAARRGSLDLLAVMNWSEEDRHREFASSAMKRATLAMMKRNALIAAGNVLAARGHAELEARVRAIAEDQTEPALVRETAAAVVARLSGGASAGQGGP